MINYLPLNHRVNNYLPHNEKLNNNLTKNEISYLKG